MDREPRHEKAFFIVGYPTCDMCLKREREREKERKRERERERERAREGEIER